MPLHKSEPREDVKNYRPMVIQYVLVKLIEKLVLKKMWPFFRSVISSS